MTKGDVLFSQAAKVGYKETTADYVTIPSVFVAEVESLRDKFPSHDEDKAPEQEFVLVDTIRKPGMKPVSRAFYAGGPRKSLHFEPASVNAAIVTVSTLSGNR